MGNLGVGELFLMLFFVLIFSFIYVIPFWKILQRVGHSPGWSLLVMIPFVNFIALYVFAFSRWPIDDKLTKPVP